MFYIAIAFYLFVDVLARLGIPHDVLVILWIIAAVLLGLAILFLFVPSPIVIRRDSPPT